MSILSLVPWLFSLNVFGVTRTPERHMLIPW